MLSFRLVLTAVSSNPSTRSIVGNIGSYYSPLASLFKFDPEKNPALETHCIEWQKARSAAMDNNDLDKNFAEIHHKFLASDLDEKYWEAQVGLAIVEGSPMQQEVLDSGRLSNKDFLVILSRYRTYVDSVPTAVGREWMKEENAFC